MKKTLIAIALGILVIFTSISCNNNDKQASSPQITKEKDTILKIPDYITKAKTSPDSKVEFYGKFTPRSASEGERVVIELQVTNLGKRTINNLGVSFTNNFFKSLVISRTAPIAKIKKNADETVFYWGKLGPSESLTSNIVVYGSELGQLKSYVFLKDGEELLKTPSGEILKENAHIDIYR